MRGVILPAVILLVLLIVMPLVHADIYEPDDSIANATTISTNSTWQAHNFSKASDADFVSFSVISGFTYSIETQALTDVSFTDTILTVYDQSNSSFASSDDQGAANTNSLVRITPTTNGTWHARITEYDGDSGGEYQVRVTRYGLLQASISTLDINETVTNNTLFTVNATITCSNSSCGHVTGILDPKQSSDEYVVAFREQSPPDNAFLRFLWRIANSGKQPAAAAIQESGGQIQKLYEKENLALAELTAEQLEALRGDPRVAGIDPNIKLYAQLDTTLPLINADDVHNMSVNGVNLTGIGQTVCVIDTGIDYTHPDLGGCNSTSDINDDSCSKVIGGYDYVNSDTDPMDDDDHGTHVAGIVAGNGSTYRGVAPGANLVAIKALDSNGEGSLSDVVAGMNWCITNAESLNISSISMSLGGGIYPAACSGFSTFETAVSDAHAKNITVFAASGNDNLYGLSTPACVPGIISVGSSTDLDARSSFSNYDPLLDIYAPGSSVRAPFLGGGYTTKSGTSMATPHVAGLSALIAQNALLLHQRSLSAADMFYRLLDSGYDVSDSQTSAPRIDALDGIDSKGIIPTFPTTPFWTSDTNPVSCGVMSAGQQCNLSWQVNATGSNGTYEFFVIANTTEQIVESSRYNVTIFTPADLVAPQISFTYNSSWLNSSSNVTFNVSDNYNLSNTSLLGVHGGNLVVLEIGNNSVINTSNSTFSNVTLNISLHNISEGAVNFTINSTNASLSLGDIGFYADNVSVFIAAISNTSASLIVGASINYTYNDTSVNSVFEVSLEGRSVLSVEANDTTNNFNSENITVLIDATPPQTSASYTTGWRSYHQINLSATDALSGVAQSYLQLPNGSIVNTSSYNVSVDGTQNYSYYSSDVAGNLELLSNISFKVDSSAPEFLFNISPSEPSPNQTVNVSLLVNDTSGVALASVYLQGQLYALDNSTLNISYNHSVLGRVNISANVTDLAGNQANLSTSVLSYEQSFYNATFNTSSNFNQSALGVEIDLYINESTNSTFSVKSTSTSPFNASMNSAFRYVTITPGAQIPSRIRSTILRFRYTDAQVSDVNESSLTIARYNESQGAFVNLSESLYFVNSVGVNTDLNFVWANVTSFSTYTFAGDPPIEPSEQEEDEEEESSSSSSGGGGGGGSSPVFGFEQVVSSVATFNFLEAGVEQYDEFTRGDWIVKNASVIPAADSRYASITLTKVNYSQSFAAYEVDVTTSISSAQSYAFGFDPQGNDFVEMQSLEGDLIASAQVNGRVASVTFDSLSDFMLVAVAAPEVVEQEQPSAEPSEEVEQTQEVATDVAITQVEEQLPASENLVGQAATLPSDAEDPPNFWLAMIVIVFLTGGALAMKVMLTKRTG